MKRLAKDGAESNFPALKNINASTANARNRRIYGGDFFVAVFSATKQAPE